MVTVTSIPPTVSKSSPPAHHVGTPPTSFINPWPSFDTNKQSLLNVFKTRFSSDRPGLIPVPPREELVQIRKPDWGNARQGLKVTWIGHASFLIETTRINGASRGLRILCDPVFSERTSPVQFFGPKRYTPTPCTLDELPDVDAVIISHNHYDHLDHATIKYLHEKRKNEIHFFCALGNASWFHSCGIGKEQVTELDWWDGVRADVLNIGSVILTCTPAQHFSGRGIRDRGKTLWCSWVVHEMGSVGPATEKVHLEYAAGSTKGAATVPSAKLHTLYFAGDTGYRSVTTPDLPPTEESSLPHCPAFAEIGQRFGPFDLALLPIGLCAPRCFMSPVHCNPADSICIHKDIQSKKSIGMHWGTVRGGLSQEYEDVRDPPRWWREAAEREGLSWGKEDGEIGLLDIGETIVLD